MGIHKAAHQLQLLSEKTNPQASLLTKPLHNKIFMKLYSFEIIHYLLHMFLNCIIVDHQAVYFQF